ncbi:MAG: hypothetical protein Q9M22_00675 [Mariprofundaceae bacterium]|nr:hypothetical protein [Mariprofundaceae bacterium]
MNSVIYCALVLLHEIQTPPERYRIVDRNHLASLCGVRSEDRLRELHLEWNGGELRQEPARQGKWTESIAIGSESYIEQVKEQLALLKQVTQDKETTMIQEPCSAYNAHFDTKMGLLSPENSIFFDETCCK